MIVLPGYICLCYLFIQLSLIFDSILPNGPFYVSTKPIQNP